MYGIIPATKPMLKASGIVNLNEITRIDYVYSIKISLNQLGTVIECIDSLDLPYISMYVKQDDVEPSFFELLKRQIRNQCGSHQKECVNRR